MTAIEKRLGRLATIWPAACPACRGGLEARGMHERQVVTQGDRVVRLRRQYATCSACGTGLFPPG